VTWAHYCRIEMQDPRKVLARKTTTYEPHAWNGYDMTEYVQS